MNTTNLLMVLAVVAVIASAVVLVNNVAISRTGMASSDTGNVTLVIESKIDINFTNSLLNWSIGNVDPAQSWAYLNSEGVNINNLSWLNVTRGLVLQSDSSMNLTVNLTSNKNAFNFLDSGVVVSPPSQFLWKVNMNQTFDYGADIDGEVGSCNASLTPLVWTAVPTTNVSICSNFGFADAADELEIDVALNISKNAPVGPKNVTLTATAMPI